MTVEEKLAKSAETLKQGGGKMDRVLVNVSKICDGEKGAVFLQSLLQRVLSNVLQDRLGSEMYKIHRGNSKSSHWIHETFLNRVMMTLCRPDNGDLFMKVREYPLLAIEMRKLFHHPVTLRFEILERSLTLKLTEGNLVEMIFHEHLATEPDVKIQGVLRRELADALKENRG